MAEEPRTSMTAWPGVRDWLRIFSGVRLALHPAKLVLALAALTLTYCWGTTLDGVWKLSGQGVGASAIPGWVSPAAALEDSPPAELGIGELWGEHTLAHIQAALHAAVTLNLVGPTSVWESAGRLCHGTRWLVAEHLWFALLFLVGALAIWSFFGSAICRIAAVQFAREEKIEIAAAIRFAREKFFSGFFIAPLLPIFIMLGIALLLAIGGALLSIPGIGNLIALFFPLALAGGLALALVLIGFAGGGSLFWPTVAVEGSDGFDAISRSFSYFFGRPVKTILYGFTALVWGGICWVVFKYVLWITLAVAHACVSFGVGGFGTGWWGMRAGIGEGMTKLDILWQRPVLSDLYAIGERSHMGGWEIFAAILIGVWVLLAVGLLWAFLASFYFSTSTIVYYLLRHDVDATDCEEVYVDEEERTDDLETKPAPTPEGDAGPPAGEGGSLPVVSTPPEPPPPSTQNEDGAQAGESTTEHGEDRGETTNEDLPKPPSNE